MHIGIDATSVSRNPRCTRIHENWGSLLRFLAMPTSNSFTAAQYEAICESLPDPTFILTASGRYAAILGGKDKRYYHDGSSLVGKYIADVLAPAKTAWFVQQIRDTLASQQMLVVEYELSAHDVLGLPTDGPVEPIWFEGRISALDQPYLGEAAVVWVASNITEGKRLQRLLRHQALTDELTGLHNRRGFMQALEQAFAQFQRDAAKAACLITFDVDHFKTINDVLGHPAGDQALRALAQAVLHTTQATDLACRLGGDEFAILCPNLSLPATAALAQEVLHRGHTSLQPYATSGSQPSLSIGIASLMPGDTSPEDILRRADQALYTSKMQGGHRTSSCEMTASVGLSASVT